MTGHAHQARFRSGGIAAVAIVETVTTENFEQRVLQSKTPVLLDFWADWCPPCVKLAATMEEIAKERSGVLTVAKVNVDRHPQLVASLQITSMPSVLLFKDGQQVERIAGALPRQQILDRISPHLG